MLSSAGAQLAVGGCCKTGSELGKVSAALIPWESSRVHYATVHEMHDTTSMRHYIW